MSAPSRQILPEEESLRLKEGARRMEALNRAIATGQGDKPPQVVRRPQDNRQERIQVANALILVAIEESARVSKDSRMIFEAGRQIERDLLEEAEAHLEMRRRTRQDANR